ncbi:MAG: GNAT family N-acetyltransferase [Alphaproteobacteria bacterium]|nr:GNAT family N-acetyltransferase [Alphaproteobacteria bacterium]
MTAATQTDPTKTIPHSDELDFSAPVGDGYESLSRDRYPVRSMKPADLAAMIEIDRRITGRDRTPYYQRKVAEALEETGIRVSLVAEQEGRVAGYIMANVDFGEFGRLEPEAVIHTIGVDPDLEHGHIGSALMSQLLANLATLHVERIYTEVDWSNAGLLGFLNHCGFLPSQRLAFVKRID